MRSSCYFCTQGVTIVRYFRILQRNLRHPVLDHSTRFFSRFSSLRDKPRAHPWSKQCVVGTDRSESVLGTIRFFAATRSVSRTNDNYTTVRITVSYARKSWNGEEDARRRVDNELYVQLSRSLEDLRSNAGRKSHGDRYFSRNSGVRVFGDRVEKRADR